jgi:predicted Zn-dependent protease/predicted negative regulator of RcsB-dependent stress response
MMPIPLRGVLLVTFAAASLAAATAGSGAPPAGESAHPATPANQASEVREIVSLFAAGQHDAVLQKTSEFLVRYPLSKDTFPVLLVEAETRFRLDDLQGSLAAFQRTLPFIHDLHNVAQRRFAWVFFRLGTLHHRQARPTEAIQLLEAGLTREPQNVYFQIMLGELVGQRGDRHRALKHFTELLASAAPNTEQRLVLNIKIDRLTNAPRRAPSVDMASQPIYAGSGFGIVALNRLEPAVSLKDVCVFLESKWLMPCQVMPPMTVAEDAILNPARRQHDGQQILAELSRRYPQQGRPHRYILALTREDLFAPDTNFVFSWQDTREGLAVISTYRFLAELDDFYERPTVATRRVAIQVLSTSSSLLGFTRPTKPHCPSAYPHDFGEFLQKGSKLCDSEIEQRDGFLRRAGGTAERFGVQRASEVDRVYRTYYFE